LAIRRQFSSCFAASFASLTVQFMFQLFERNVLSATELLLSLQHELFLFRRQGVSTPCPGQFGFCHHSLNFS
jgi:hypothetical protein